MQFSNLASRLVEDGTQPKLLGVSRTYYDPQERQEAGRTGDSEEYLRLSVGL